MKRRIARLWGGGEGGGLRPEAAAQAARARGYAGRGARLAAAVAAAASAQGAGTAAATLAEMVAAVARARGCHRSNSTNMCLCCPSHRWGCSRRTGGQRSSHSCTCKHAASRVSRKCPCETTGLCARALKAAVVVALVLRPWPLPLNTEGRSRWARAGMEGWGGIARNRLPAG